MDKQLHILSPYDNELVLPLGIEPGPQDFQSRVLTTYT